MVLFGIYADGQFVALIDGERAANIERSKNLRVRGGVYWVSPGVEDGARWELACSWRPG